MKTSTKLLIAAIVVLFGTTAAYDFALKGIYEKGSYKDPMYRFTKLEFSGFDEIVVNAAHRLGVEIIHSDTFDVRVDNYAKSYVKFRQEGSRLIIDLDLGSNRFFPKRMVVIKCPVIKFVKTDAVHSFKGKDIVAANNVGDYSGGKVTMISGFNQDSLNLIINNASVINLRGNKVEYLGANVGLSKLSQSGLGVDKTNEINYAHFNIQNKSKLTLDDINFNHLEYNISDSAQINLSGVSLKLIKNQ